MFSPTLLLSDCVSLFILHMTGLAFLLKSVELSLETVNCHWCRLGCYKSRPHKPLYVCCRLAYTTTLLLFIIASFFYSPATLGSLYTPHTTFLSLRCKSVVPYTMLCLFSDFIHSISTELAVKVQCGFSLISRWSQAQAEYSRQKKNSRRKKKKNYHDDDSDDDDSTLVNLNSHTSAQTITSPELMRALEEGWLAVKLAKNQKTMTWNDFHARMVI